MAKIQLDIPLKPHEIRELSDVDLGQQLEAAREKLYHLRYKMHVEEVENPTLKGVIRRNIARMMTIQHERQMAGESAS